VRPDALFMDPLAEPAPPVSPASPESAAPAIVFAAPAAPQGVEDEDEPWTEPDIPFPLRPSGEQQPRRQRAGQRTNREGRNGGRGDGRDRRAN
jgi:hypothetical protein